MPSRILSYSKIVKGERNTKRSLLIFIAEPLPILFKDSERREKYKKKLAYFYCRAAAYLIKR